MAEVAADGAAAHRAPERTEVRAMAEQGGEVTIVGQGAKLEGTVVSAGSLRVDGQVKGQINAEGDVLLSPQSQVEADIRAQNVSIAGRFRGNVQVKGKAQEIQVYELMWQQSEDMTTLASHKSVFKPRNTTLRLKMQGTEVVLSAERPSLAMGRDQSADFVIKERMASRAHGKIERRLDKFILTDHSANGTFVTIEGDVR